MHGKGKITWLDGRYYEGEYVDDKKQGEGLFDWGDGRKYIGQWYKGKQHGRGLYIMTNGEKRIGEWVDGRRVVWIDEAENDAIDQNKDKQFMKQPSIVIK